jgi:hypothetical protein
MAEINSQLAEDNWKTALKNKSFMAVFSITLLTILSFSVIFNYFFDFVESRNGTHLTDFIVSFFPAKDLSFFIFFFLYSGIILFLLFHLSSPSIVLTAFLTYALVTLTRIGTITLFPLEPPEGYIPLKEPFVQLFTNGGKIISKDLFFSGHMSTILSICYASKKPWLKRYLYVCSFMIGTGVIVQHVHYTIDVIVAIPATWGWYYISKRFLNPLG